MHKKQNLEQLTKDLTREKPNWIVKSFEINRNNNIPKITNSKPTLSSYHDCALQPRLRRQESYDSGTESKIQKPVRDAKRDLLGFSYAKNLKNWLLQSYSRTCGGCPVATIKLLGKMNSIC